MITSSGSATLSAQTVTPDYGKKETVLLAMQAGTLDLQQALAYLAKIERTERKVTVSIKVSDKGGVGFRGVPGTNGKFGMTLYGKTIEWLYENRETVEKFIADNREQLAWEKPVKAATDATDADADADALHERIVAAIAA